MWADSLRYPSILVVQKKEKKSSFPLSTPPSPKKSRFFNWNEGKYRSFLETLIPETNRWKKLVKVMPFSMIWRLLSIFPYRLRPNEAILPQKRKNLYKSTICRCNFLRCRAQTQCTLSLLRTKETRKTRRKWKSPFSTLIEITKLDLRAALCVCVPFLNGPLFISRPNKRQ